MLSAGFRRPEQFLPRVQALVWDLASALPSSLDGSPPAWLIAVLLFGDGPAMRNLAGCRFSARSRYHETHGGSPDRPKLSTWPSQLLEAVDLWHKARCVPGTADETQCGFRMVEFFTLDAVVSQDSV